MRGFLYGHRCFIDRQALKGGELDSIDLIARLERSYRGSRKLEDSRPLLYNRGLDQGTLCPLTSQRTETE